MFKFIYPYALLLLVVTFVFLVWYVILEFHRSKQFKAFGNMELLKRLMPTRSPLRQRIKFALVWLSLVALIFMVARTQFASTNNDPPQTLNVEMIAVVDVSNSMLATDEVPSRMEKAKVILNNFFEKADNIKFGLVEFAGTSVTRMPLTSDISSAKMFVNSMSPADISSQGTAIGAALRQAQKSFSKEDNGAVRCIVLLTDAENHEDDAVATAAAVQEGAHCIIDVIGIGSETGSNIIVGDSVLNDENGNPVLSKIDVNGAKEIALKGKGKYFTSESPADIVDGIKSQLRENATSAGVSVKSLSFVDVFPYFAWFAFFCLLADCLIMERKNHLRSKLKNLKFWSK